MQVSWYIFPIIDATHDYTYGSFHLFAGGVFFLDAPGGTGKTFLINTVLATIRSKNEIALATASSGIAATLLSGGRTLHSRFKIPLDAHRQELPMCSIKKGTVLAKIILDCKAIIIDEAPMTHRCAFEAIDRTLLVIFQHCFVVTSGRFYQL